MPSPDNPAPAAERGHALHKKASQLIPGGVNSATRNIGYPAAFSHARGSTITDLDGREFVDYHCAFGATLLGHNDERVNAAVAETLGTIDLVGLGITDLEVQAAQLVHDLIPSVEMSITTMSGTESTFQAVRLARAATGRKYVLKFQGCFHGWHDAVARNVASSAESAWGHDPLSAGILDDALEATLIAEFNDLGSVEEAFERHAGQIAAIILEPVPHNVGAVLPTDEFLRGLRELCTKTGTVLIFDEVITGFRHAAGGYQELCGVTPDLTAYGKAMGNGFPVAGMGGRRDLMEQFSSAGGDVLLAGTYNGNPASMAAAVATMTAINDPEVGFHDHVYRLGERMRFGLAQIMKNHDVPAVVTGIGSVFVTYFLSGTVSGYRDLLRNNDVAYAEFHRRMIDQGFMMYPMTLKRNHITLAHTADQIDQTLAATDGVISSMVRDGVFDRPVHRVADRAQSLPPR
ncbi:aspartate aminotransferase family protein [Pseudactinotalea sp. Z1748]|uniref:aspartate aminotransferase family protein n=1 Tax=Pseudactinotalea sp. Z1748 TaxID=3413027 RepID=UPI003C7DE3DF